MKTWRIVEPEDKDGNITLEQLKDYLKSIFEKAPPKVIMANEPAANAYAQILGYKDIEEYMNEQFNNGNMVLEFQPETRVIDVPPRKYTLDIGQYYAITVTFKRGVEKYWYGDQQIDCTEYSSRRFLAKTVKEINDQLSLYRPDDLYKIELEIQNLGSKTSYYKKQNL